MKYEVIRNLTKIADKEYVIGDVISHFEGYDFATAIRFGFIKPIDGSVENTKTVPQVSHPVVSENKNYKKATITRGGPWFKVLDENGELLGKATRDESEANQIKEEYEQA